MVFVKFQFMYATTSKIDSQLLLASTSSKVLLGRGSEEAFNEYLGLSSVFPSVAQVQIWVLRLIAANKICVKRIIQLALLFIKIFLLHKLNVSEFSAGNRY